MDEYGNVTIDFGQVNAGRCASEDRMRFIQNDRRVVGSSSLERVREKKRRETVHVVITIMHM
jgi:hypothetical protein